MTNYSGTAVYIPIIRQLRDIRFGKPKRDAIATLLEYCVAGTKHSTSDHAEDSAYCDPGEEQLLSLSQETGYALCGKDMWIPTRRILKDAGIIELRQRYKVGERADRYHINHPANCKWGWYDLQSKKGRDRYLSKTAETKANLSEHALIQVNHLSTTGVPSNQEEVDRRRNSDMQTVHDRWVIFGASSVSWAKQDRWGRLYTPFTLMRREDRNIFRFGGEVTKQVDVVNCTPLLLAAEAKSSNECDPSFIDDCENGVLYEQLMEGTGLTREIVKEHCQRLHNARYPSQKNGFDVFEARYQELYPRMHKWIRESIWDQVQKGLFELAIPMESKIMLHAVASLIESGVPSASIHDCILCPKSAVCTVKETILEAFSYHLYDAVSPSFKCSCTKCNCTKCNCT